MFARYDFFKRLETPTLILCNPNNEQLCTLYNVTACSLSLTFNAVSELSVTISKYPYNVCYDLIRLKRQILIEGLGYFKIRDFNESSDGESKTIVATSCEIELNDVEVPFIPDGTYYLYNDGQTDKSLIHYLLPAMPAWAIDTSASGFNDIKDIQRTFEGVEGTIYSFLVNKLSDTYEAIAEFDVLQRKFSLIPRQNALSDTEILLSRMNFLNEVTVQENSDEYANCISVTGGDDETNITRVNPMGNNLLFDFTYDIEQGLLSSGLVSALGDWKSAFETQEPLYLAKQREYIDKLEEVTQAFTEKSASEIAFASADESYRVAMAGSDSALQAEALANKNTAQGTLTTKTNAYNSKVNELEVIEGQITDIQALVQFDVFMTNEQITELYSCIQQANYNDEFIIITDSMTQDERLDQMVELYEKTKRMLQGGTLEGISEPRREISLNTESFAFSKDFQHLASQLETGCLIDVEQPDETIEKYILQRIDVDYAESDIKFTFGNRYRISNPSAVFGDLYNNTSDMAKIVASNYIQWGKQITRVNELELERESAIQLNTTRVINSTNQRNIIGEKGIYCLSTDPLTGELNGHGIAIADGTIVFFDDFDKNVEFPMQYVNGRMAVGRTLDGEGNPDYGIVGGNIIAGTITADKIVAGAVSKGTNLVRDGSFEDIRTFLSVANSWEESPSSGATWAIQGTGGFDTYQFIRGTSSVVGNTNGLTQKTGNIFTVAENNDYYLSFYYKFPTTNTGDDAVVGIKIQWLDSGSSEISTSQITTSTKSNSWRRRHGKVVSPAGAVSARVSVFANYFVGTVDFDGIMVEQSAILNAYSPYYGEFVSRYTVINDEGIAVRNGRIKIFNNANETVFEADELGNLDITAKITASSGLIGGWSIDDSRIYKDYTSEGDNRTSALAVATNPSGSNTAFVIGGINEVGLGFGGPLTNFRVTYDGTVTARKGTIGGWAMSSDELTSGSGATRVGMSSKTDESIAFWCGNDTKASAPFRVTRAGALTSTSGNIAGWEIGSNILKSSKDATTYAYIQKYFTDTTAAFGIRIGDDYPFFVRYNGHINAELGTIGGWSLGSNLLSSGSSTATVGLSSSGTTGDIAIWCGSATAGSAPFKVTRAGALTCTDATITGTLTTGSIINSGAKIGGSSGLTVGSGVLKGNDNNYIDTDGFRIRAGELAGWTISSDAITRDTGTYYMQLKSDVSEGDNGMRIEDNVDGMIFNVSAFGLAFWDGHEPPYKVTGIASSEIYNTGGLSINSDDYVSVVSGDDISLSSGSGKKISIKFGSTTACVIKVGGIYKPDGTTPILLF